MRFDGTPVFVQVFDPATADANTLGEFLRGHTFDQSSGEFGCYTTFDLAPGVERLVGSEARDFFERDRELDPCLTDHDAYQGAVWCDDDGEFIVYAYWFWDGDGVLAFEVFDATRNVLVRTLENTDCKKDNRWRELGEDA